MSEYKDKRIKKWSNADLLQWAENAGLPSKIKDITVAKITEYGCAGQDFLNLASAKEIGTSFDITKPIVYNKIWNAFTEIKSKQEDEAMKHAAEQNQMNGNNNSNNNNNNNHQQSSLSYSQDIEQKDGEFKLNLFGQSKYWKIDRLVSKSTTIYQVKELYKDAAQIDTDTNNIILLSKGKTLESHKTLGDIGITDERHRITVKFDCVGGMAYQPEYDVADGENRRRKVNFYKYGQLLKKSKQADCVMGYDDDDIAIEGARAEIGCPKRHAMVAGTMYKWIKTTLTKNMKSVTVSCPVPVCQQYVLDWDTITAIADMNGTEYAKWTGVIEDRLKPPTKNCPHCKAEAQRKQGVVIFRMFCTACRGPDWCWNCEQQWKGGGLIYCSNSNCDLIKETNKFLRDAPLITPEYLSNVKIPNTRACPSCLTFIQHKRACKHMTCIGCTTKFCFVCMGVYDKSNNKWPCNNYDYECQPHPVQEFK